MKKAIILCSAVLGLVGAQTSAQATTWRPGGNTVFTGKVNATVNTTSLVCDISITLNVPEANPDGHTTFTPAMASDPSHGHSATVTAFTLSGGSLGLCGAASLQNLPYTATFDGTYIKVAGVQATTFIGGNCKGDFKGTWNYSTQTLTIPSQTLNDPGSTFACTFQGSVKPNHPFNVQNP